MNRAKEPLWPDILGLVVRAPRTIAELSELTGAHENTVLKVMHHLQGEGLITAGKLRERQGERGRWPQEWSWTP